MVLPRQRSGENVGAKRRGQHNCLLTWRVLAVHDDPTQWRRFKHRAKNMISLQKKPINGRQTMAWSGPNQLPPREPLLSSKKKHKSSFCEENQQVRCRVWAIPRNKCSTAAPFSSSMVAANTTTRRWPALTSWASHVWTAFKLLFTPHLMCHWTRNWEKNVGNPHWLEDIFGELAVFLVWCKVLAKKILAPKRPKNGQRCRFWPFRKFVEIAWNFLCEEPKSNKYWNPLGGECSKDLTKKASSHTIFSHADSYGWTLVVIQFKKKSLIAFHPGRIMRFQFQPERSISVMRVEEMQTLRGAGRQAWTPKIRRSKRMQTWASHHPSTKYSSLV